MNVGAVLLRVSSRLQEMNGASGSSYLASGSSSYQGVVVASDVYREKVQADQWSESFVENSDFEYDDLTTYASDGSISKQVQKRGGGEGSADLHHWGTSTFTEQYTGSGYNTSSYDENTHDRSTVKLVARVSTHSVEMVPTRCIRRRIPPALLKDSFLRAIFTPYSREPWSTTIPKEFFSENFNCTTFVPFLNQLPVTMMLRCQERSSFALRTNLWSRSDQRLCGFAALR